MKVEIPGLVKRMGRLDIVLQQIVWGVTIDSEDRVVICGIEAVVSAPI